MLSGCGVGSNTSIFDQLAAALPVAPPVVASTNSAPEMVGRWVLAAPGTGSCTLAFSAAPGAANGGVAPEGGCPGHFSASRSWTLDQQSLTLRDHQGGTLVHLNATAVTHFEGFTAGGEIITLTR